MGREHNSQYEKDWRYAIRKLKTCEDPEQIIRDMASYRSKDRYDKDDSTKLVAPAKARPLSVRTACKHFAKLVESSDLLEFCSPQRSPVSLL